MKHFLKFFLCIMAVFIFSQAAYGANENSKAAKVITEETSLNVRKTASTSSSVVKKLKKGSWVTVLAKSGSFYKVEYSQGKTGYCHSDFLKQRATSKALFVKTGGSRLNIRKGAGTSYDIKGKLENGECVVYLSQSGKWTKVLYHGTKMGYVLSDYLSEKKPETAFKKISLNVPSYKQTDSRWKNIKIGTSGDTIGSSGCTTTALAMTESFRLGKTITPKDMAASLTYAPAGWLYWPENYKTVLVSSSDYLSLIYEKLISGKPVILGSKNSNGSQHWVTITGHKTEASSLSAKNFTINDPGSSTRTNLSQFIEHYPKLYKLAYYN